MSAGTIAAFRDLVPIRPLSLIEARRIAELQATRLLVLSGVTEPPVPKRIAVELPKVQVEYPVALPMSGVADWSHGRWLILIDGSMTIGRQRFTLMHELKHIIDNPFIDVIYPPTSRQTSEERAEQTCDVFAAAVLMPRTWIKRAWASGVQDPRNLARTFDVSLQAMNLRLVELGLLERGPRCATTPASEAA